MSDILIPKIKTPKKPKKPLKRSKMKPKPYTKQSAIRRSAEGKDCYLQLNGVCNHNSETVVWAHVGGLDAGAGRGLKGLDICGMPLCSECHSFIDQAKWLENTNSFIKQRVEEMLFEKLIGSFVTQGELGLIKIQMPCELFIADFNELRKQPDSFRELVRLIKHQYDVGQIVITEELEK